MNERQIQYLILITIVFIIYILHRSKKSGVPIEKKSDKKTISAIDILPMPMSIMASQNPKVIDKINNLY